MFGLDKKLVARIEKLEESQEETNAWLEALQEQMNLLTASATQMRHDLDKEKNERINADRRATAIARKPKH